MIAHARRFVFAFLAALALATGSVALTAAPAAAQRPFDDAKYAAIVIKADTGEVLYAKRADSPRYPASITKIMTLYLTFDALRGGRLKLTDTILVSPHAAAQGPSKLGLPAGQRITVEDAIRSICVISANDMAVAMAEHIGGTESRFAALMTLKAQELGMSNSRFVNANGLPDSRQIVTARDIAILSRAMMRDFPEYYPYFSTKYFVYAGKTNHNHNGLLFSMPGVDGIKTGYTRASGFNLAASATRNGQRLITVVMGGPSSQIRNQNVEGLLDTGFDVLARRERGELITVAQGYFERALAQPAAPVTYATLSTNGIPGDQGDGPVAAPVAHVYLPSQPVPTSHPLIARESTREPRMRPVILSRAEKRRAEQLAREDAQIEDEYRDRARHHGAHMTKAEKAREAREEREDRLADARDRKHGGSKAERARQEREDRLADSRGKKKETRGAYLVQVGSFRQKTEARGWLRDIGQRFDDQLAEARGTIVTVDGWYRTRFMGLTRDAAADTCRAMKAHRLACQVIRG
jgi:D-alanyl-D-alanine carboxypeptidase